MSLGVIVKAPEGLVLAAESRMTLTVKRPNNQVLPVHFDNATKLFSFQQCNKIGVVTWGQALIGKRSAQNLMPEFEADIQKESELSVLDFANFLSKFFVRHWNTEMKSSTGPPITFAVGGFDKDEPYGKVYLIEIPNKPDPEERNSEGFGYTWGGQREMVDRITRGYDPAVPQLIAKKFNFNRNKISQLENELRQLQIPFPIDTMPLQDCVNLAVFFIRTTITAQSLSIGLRGCGGPIDVATITQADGLKFVQKKQITGEGDPLF